MVADDSLQDPDPSGTPMPRSSSCAPWRDALSARADGEALPVAVTALDDHLAGCADCAAFSAGVNAMARRVRVAPAEEVPDLTASILAAVETPAVARHRQRFGQLRGVLALVGVVQLVLAVPALTGLGGLGSHLSREVGIFEVALGVGFLLVARRPARAVGLLPVAGVVALLVVATSIGDVAAGTTTALQETAHLLEVVGTGLLLALHRLQGREILRPAAA